MMPLKRISCERNIILTPCIRDICAKAGIPNSPQSPDIGQNSNGGISDFRISGQSLIKVNCQTLEPVTVLT